MNGRQGGEPDQGQMRPASRSGRRETRVTSEDLVELSQSLAFAFGIEHDHRGPSISTLQGPLLSGRIEIHEPRSGLHLLVLDIDVRSDLELEVSMERPMVSAAVVLSGSSAQRVKGLGSESTISFDAETNVIGSYGNDRSVFALAAGERHRLVDVKLSPELAAELVETYGVPMSSPLRHLLESTGAARKSIRSPLPQRLKDLAHDVLRCQLDGPTRRLYMEAKALEILSLELETFFPTRAPDAARSEEEIEKLEHARSILHSELHDPPSIVELARRIGLNELKLKKGFREVFGTTVYGHVRRLRLEHAHALLISGDHNVTEAAMAAGYSCLGHFSSAFRKHFGLLPSQVRSARQMPCYGSAQE